VKVRIHVNRHNIAANRKAGSSDRAVFAAATYKGTQRGNSITLRDKAGAVVLRGVWSPDKPLPCGATLWLEADTDQVTVEVV